MFCFLIAIPEGKHSRFPSDFPQIFILWGTVCHRNSCQISPVFHHVVQGHGSNGLLAKIVVGWIDVNRPTPKGWSKKNMEKNLETICGNLGGHHGSNTIVKDHGKVIFFYAWHLVVIKEWQARKSGQAQPGVYPADHGSEKILRVIPTVAFQDISFDIKSNKPHLPGGDLSKSKNSLNSDSPLIHSNSWVNSVIVFSSLNSSMLVDSKIFQRDGDETDHSGIQPTSNKRCGSDPCDTAVGGSSYYDHPKKNT